MGSEYWKSFEKRVLHDLNLQRVAVTQIPSHMQQVKSRTFRKKTDCDFAAGPDGRAVFFDAKVCAESTFNYKSLVFRNEKIHQYRFLISCVERGCEAGYLIWFYNEHKIVWLPIENIRPEDTSIKTDSPLVKTQDDGEPINLTRLIWGP